MVYSRLSTSQLYQSGLEGIYKNQAAMNEALQEISSGKKNMSPVEIAQSLSYNVNISNYSQYNKNGETVLPKLNTQEVAIRDIIDNLQSLRDLVVENKSSSNTANKDLYLEKFNNIKDSLLADINIKDPYNNFVFSGYSGNTEPFPTILSNYMGDQGVSEIRIGDDNFVELNFPGSDILTTEMQTAISDFGNYLNSNTPLSNTVLDNLDQGLSDLEVVLTKLGGRMNKIEQAATLSNNIIASDESRLSELQDADLTSAINKLNSASNALQASLKAQVTIQSLTIFDYM